MRRWIERIVAIQALLLLLVLIHQPHAVLSATIDPHQQLQFADKLYEQGQYRRAAEEYQRFIFFFPDAPGRPQAVFRSGQAFLQAGETRLALAQFKQLTHTFDPDPLAIESFFMMVECYLQMQSPTQAIAQLHNLVTLSDTEALKDRAYHRLAWIHIDLADWDGARLALAKITKEGRNRYRIDDLGAALDQSSTIPRKSPALAGTLSIVPGAGQLYCRRYQDAVIALIVNVGLFWSAYDAYDQEQYALGSLLAFVGLGFYSGNIYGAVTDAHKYNQSHQRAYVDQLKQSYLFDHADRMPQASVPGLFLSLNFAF